MSSAFDGKRKRWTTDNFLNLVPPHSSKFKYTDGREQSFPVDFSSSSLPLNFKIQTLITTPNSCVQEKFDSKKTILENLTLHEKNEIKVIESKRNSEVLFYDDESSYEVISNKTQNLMRQINDNKEKILRELEKNVKINAILNEVEQSESIYRELYRKKVIFKNDCDCETNKIFESFQKKINDLNMNPLKQQYNYFVKEEKRVEGLINEGILQENKINNQIRQNTNLLSTIKDNVEEFENKIEEKKKFILEEIILTKTKFKETFKNLFEIRLLKEQITIMKSTPKTFTVIRPKNLARKNIFNYETYLKISKNNKFLSLISNEKISNPLKTMPKLINEENFHTPMKEKLNFDASDEENPLKKCKSESDTKFIKSKMNFLKKPPNSNQNSYKFDLIIDNQYNNFYFQDDHSKKLYFELEVALKGSFIRNWDNLLKNVSFNSMDYDFFLNLENIFFPYKKILSDEILTKLQREKMEIESSEIIENTKKEKQEYILKHLSDNYSIQSLKKAKSGYNLPPTNIIFIGDRNRGTLFEFLPIMLEDLKSFENKIIKVGDVKYSFDLGDPPQKFLSQKSEEMMSELKNCEKYQEKKILILNLFFEVHQKADLEIAPDIKRISLFLITLNMENCEVVLKQLAAVLTKEKTSVQKDKNIESIEQLFKNNTKLVVVNELPNLLKNNRKSAHKFEKIQRILEFSKSLTNNY